MERTNYLLLPVIAGLISGSLLIVVLALAVNPPLPSRFGHADNPTGEDRTRVIDMLDKSKELEPVNLFLDKYPFAVTGIYSYLDSPVYDDEDNVIAFEFRATFVYSGSTITRIEYQEVKLNNLLVSYHTPSLWVTVDQEGNLEEISLRCGLSYLGHVGGMATSVDDYDVIIEFLKSNLCWR